MDNTSELIPLISVLSQGYCLQASGGVSRQAPTLLSRLRPHMDCVTHLDTCLHGDQLFLLSASIDCTVALSYLPGHHVGIFGQVSNNNNNAKNNNVNNNRTNEIAGIIVYIVIINISSNKNHITEVVCQLFQRS